ncbi:MAG: DUF2141 domain-containing protein [Alphaproteobacteria bacterium]|nr:MAG: DUF2141 domain-containing protein [Alphaproteobacteria bacterium]
MIVRNRNVGTGIIELLLSLALLIVVSNAVAAGSINVAITGIRNDQGLIRCGLYSSAAGFRVPGKQFRDATGKIQGGRAVCAFNAVPAGTYAVAVFHAERGESQVTFGLLGKPTEGVGFSRNPTMTTGPPSFEAAAFPVGGSSPVDLTVKLKY